MNTKLALHHSNSGGHITKAEDGRILVWFLEPFFGHMKETLLGRKKPSFGTCNSDSLSLPTNSVKSYSS